MTQATRRPPTNERRAAGYCPSAASGDCLIMSCFRIGVTPDFTRSDGEPVWWDPQLAALAAEPNVEVEFLPAGGRVLTPEQIAPYDAVVTWGAEYAPESFAGGERLTQIARLGVGYDQVDLVAATAHDVLVTVTVGAASRPVAEGALTLILALAHQVGQKERLVRSGRWKDRDYFIGIELRDRVVGTIGFGNIARELFRLLASFGLRRMLACDPYARSEDAAALGVELLPLDELLRESDVVSIHSSLSEETRGLIGARELRLMKPSAFLVNTARGPIIREADLIAALRDGVIRGAALDVFAQEPIASDNPLLEMENVLLCPHGIAWTEELFRDYFAVLISQVNAVRRGDVPEHVVNRDVLDRRTFRAKLAAYRRRFTR